ncbi:hypothetical protein LEP1GSC151_4135 [Leptospira interrogans serovar Grippotyphosa str. LT2186]|uniref:Uncharacterized protein n=3 Tax=Leptospira interrogans TaxID=173 RepID=M3HLM7_LEPIR|nr:hypothetical protein LEP1GSC067_1673 [Leptospira interrogans serovar Lora str. TE 1992]EMG13495.1 hypothetical protein LEP1GSC151_4135 [Leptospira interrogans serovar Grippotyphosa str. LT2186]EMG20854.1 hypothetical protein LEP1GSC150_0022 [Leptospira interrogans serovar Copenhageni str. LT2050]
MFKEYQALLFVLNFWNLFLKSDLISFELNPRIYEYITKV